MGIVPRGVPMNDTPTLPFAKAVECVFRYGIWARRLGGPPKPDCTPEIIASWQMGFVCAGIPLCGTRMLKQFFLSHPTVNFQAELLRDTIQNVLASKRAGNVPTLFAIVRNPWSRVVSCYEKKIRGGYLKRSYRGYKGIATIAGYEGLSVTMSFSAFVEWLCSERGRDHLANRHWMSQHKFLPVSDVDSKNIQLLRLESIEKDLNSILAQFGLPYLPVPKLNSSARTAVGRLHARTEDYYTPETINAVRDRYAKDIEMFGYDFC
jgi:hypothetical protein